MGLGVLRRLAFSRRGGDRLGMGDRRLDRLRIVARPRPRQGRRHAASGRRARQHSCLLCLAGAHVGQHGGVVGHLWPQRLALPVPDRGFAGAGCPVDQAQHPRIAALGRGKRTPPRRTCPASERRCARRCRRRADSLHRGRSVRRSLVAPAADRRLPDDAVGDLRLLGGRYLHPDLCRRSRRQGRAVGTGVGRLGRPDHRRMRYVRVRQPRLSCRRHRP